MASNTELPSGYDYQFVVQVHEDYICSICHLVMRKPVQTRCGHRFCKDCLDAALRKQPKCPLDNESLTSQQIFEDVATERQILSLKIKCPNHCDWQGELRDVQTHDEKCPLTIVPCSYVSIGCNFKGPRRYLSDHNKNNLVEHHDITTQKLLTLEDENINLKRQVVELMASSTENVNDLKKQVLELKASSSENMNDLKKQVLELKASNIGLMTKDDQSHYSYTWKINDLSKQLQLAKQQDRDIILYSEPFYTHKYGYKLKLRFDPYGVGPVKGTHASVYMIIMRGEYDAILTWPFNWKYKFTLLDQKPDHTMCKNIGHFYRNPDSSGDWFQRPVTEKNVGIGHPILLHETLKTENYVVDGAVFIKFELQDPSMKTETMSNNVNC